MRLGRLWASGGGRHLAAATLSVLSACGGAVEADPGGTGGAGGGASDATATGAGGDGTTTGSTSSTSATASATTSATTGAGGGASSTTGAGGAGGFCDETCAALYEASCYSVQSCLDECEVRAPAWPDEVRAAYAQCLAGNPLCFESVDGCMLTVLHPAGTLHRVVLTGAGFHAFDGQTFRVWNDPGDPVPFGGEAVIAGGAFAFEWEVPVSVFGTGGPLLLAYIDLDGDGECKAAADLTTSQVTQWNGDLLEPVYSATLEPPLLDPDFVCDFTP
jgi:hypothetical protein